MTAQRTPARTLIHFVFTTKRRKAVFADPRLGYFCERYLRDSAQRQGISIRALAVQGDHVHILAYLPTRVSVATAAHHLKWWSSYNLRQRHHVPLVTDKALWGHRFWHVSVGGGVHTQEQYIQEQSKAFRGDWEITG